MRAVLFANGNPVCREKVRQWVRPEDTVICADGGLGLADKLGFVPDVVLGDFDSLPAGVEVQRQWLRYPVQKDFTDGELAVEYALEKGFEELLLIGFTGTRMDHTLANLFLLKKIAEHGRKAVILDDYNEIYLLTDTLALTGNAGDIVSILPLTEKLEGVVTEGLYYPLRKETLFFSQSRGVSNVMEGQQCRITAEKGYALVIRAFEE